MKKLLMILSLALLTVSAQAGKPWDNGKLRISDNQRYLQFENGQPFFWLGETGWLLPERLDRAEAEWYLQRCAKAGYNVVQVQTIDGVPAYNIYGQMSNIDGWNFKTRKVSMAIGTTWTISSTRLPTRVSISVWYASGVDW